MISFTLIKKDFTFQIDLGWVTTEGFLLLFLRIFFNVKIILTMKKNQPSKPGKAVCFQVQVPVTKDPQADFMIQAGDLIYLKQNTKNIILSLLS